MLNKRNKTGHTGVCFEQTAQKYRAYIFYNGVNIRLGYFSKIEDALQARQDAEEFYRGDLGTDKLRVIEVFKSRGDPRSEQLLFLSFLGILPRYEFGKTQESIITYLMRGLTSSSSVSFFSSSLTLSEFLSSFPPFFIEWLNGASIRSLSKKYPEHKNLPILIKKSLTVCSDMVCYDTVRSK